MALTVKIIDRHEQGIDTNFFSKEQLARVDSKGLNRHFITFEINSEDSHLLIRDFLKCRFRLPVKYLASPQDMLSFQYRAQKRPVIGGDSKSIDEAVIQVEPSNSNIKDFISRIPINQKLPIGTVATINVSIPYDDFEDGSMPDYKFISSNNLKFNLPKDFKESPIIRWCHIGALDIGSELRAKYEVRLINPDIEQRSLFGFRHFENKLTIWIYDVYSVSFEDLLNLYSDYLDKYVDPVIPHMDANNEKYKLLNKERLEKLIDAMKSALKI